MSGKLDRGMMGGVSLHHNLTLKFSTSGPTSDLGQQLEGSLPGPNIRDMQPNIGIEYTNESHVRKVKPLGNHLGPDQNIDLVGSEIVQGVTQLVFPTHRVGIDSSDSGTVENLLQNLFNSLRSITSIHNRFAAAFRALLGWQLRKTTNMADEAILFAMKSHRCTAMATVRDIPAFRTENILGKSSAIQEEDGLLSIAQPLFD